MNRRVVGTTVLTTKMGQKRRTQLGDFAWVKIDINKLHREASYRGRDGQKITRSNN